MQLPADYAIGLLDHLGSKAMPLKPEQKETVGPQWKVSADGRSKSLRVTRASDLAFVLPRKEDLKL